MALIRQIKTIEKSFIKIPVSKNLAEAFNHELEIYNRSSQANNILDFDNLVKKLIDELSKINANVPEKK